MEVLFSFGTWEKYPFQRGYLIINAHSKYDAVNEFRRRYPDVNPGTLNCADVYTDSHTIREFKQNGNLGKGCHLYIDMIKEEMKEYYEQRIEMLRANWHNETNEPETQEWRNELTSEEAALVDKWDEDFDFVLACMTQEMISPEARQALTARVNASKLYIDMDGTLFRFHDTDHEYIERMWEPGFYRGLKPFENLVNAIRGFIRRNPQAEVFILSAVLPTEPPFAEAEKRESIRRYLPEIDEAHMIFVPAGADKSAYVGEISGNCYLIDDYNKNLREWAAAGGGSIKFINDVNNKGLGAYGGEKGQLWNGASIRHSDEEFKLMRDIETIICAEAPCKEKPAAAKKRFEPIR